MLRGRADLGGDARPAADDPRLLAPARAVPPPDRGEPDGPADLASTRPGPTSSTTASTRPIRSGGSCSASSAAPTIPSWSRSRDDVCTGLQLVNFLQDVPRDLALGRVYLPAEERARFGVTKLDEPNAPLQVLLRHEADRAATLLGSGEELGRRLGGRVGRAVALFARGGLAALEALERADWDIFNGRPRPSRARLAHGGHQMTERRLDGAHQRAEAPAGRRRSG